MALKVCDSLLCFFPVREADPDSHHKHLKLCVYQSLHDRVDMEEMKGQQSCSKNK